jgi:hypothetical protein
MARPAGENSEICMGVPPLVYCRAIVSAIGAHVGDERTRKM